MATIDYNARMRNLLDRASADVIALVPGANMVYFTGMHYHLSERPIIAFISEDGLSFIMPELELTRLQQRPDLNARAFVWTDTDGYRGSFAEAVDVLRLNDVRLAVDGMAMRVFEWLALREAGADTTSAVDAGALLLQIRAIKTPEEIEAIRRAIALSETALQKMLERIRAGMTETQIASILSEELSVAGSESHAFSPSVLTGPKSALPHGNTADRQLGADEFLLIDFGGRWGGYPADITRTFCLGTPTAEMRRIYDAVYAANKAAREVAGPGVTCGEVDEAARAVITEAGFGPYFMHRTGHGLGLEVHELPQIASGVDMPLEPGMVFTIEPGVYVPEVGGVRIEDNVVITADGCESLTTFPREL